LLGRILGDPIGLIGLEGFERDEIVAEEFEMQLVEIVLSDLARHVRPPIILHPFQYDRTARVKLLDLVGAGAHRLFQRGLGNVALAALAVGAFPPQLRQNHQFADDGRQFAIAG
jgi:hypothetical protein